MTRCNKCDWTLNCCETCPCNLERIEQKDSIIETKDQQILDLLTNRHTEIGHGEDFINLLTTENNKLKADLARIRGQREYYKIQRDELRTENSETAQELNNLIETLSELKADLGRLTIENQQLKNKIAQLSQQCQVVKND